MRLIYIFEMGSIVSYETHTTSAIRGQRAIIRSKHHKLKLSKKEKCSNIKCSNIYSNFNILAIRKGLTPISSNCLSIFKQQIL